MNTIQEIKNLADLRLRESRALLEAGFLDGAYYLGGYALELALKAIICKNLGISDLFADPNSRDRNDPIPIHSESVKVLKVHALPRLVVFSGLKTQIEDTIGDNPDFNAFWSEVIKWSESARYAQGKPEEEVRNFLDSIDHPVNGILTWLKQRW